MSRFIMRRRILPVGQGAFYCESFETGENIVYDCGNTNQKKYLWNETMCDNVIKSGKDVADDLLNKTGFWRYIPYNICNNR